MSRLTKKQDETPMAQLRNMLSPLYNLSSIVRLLETVQKKDQPQFILNAIEQAKLIEENKDNIKDKLLEIDSQIADNEDKIYEVLHVIKEMQAACDKNPDIITWVTKLASAIGIVEKRKNPDKDEIKFGYVKITGCDNATGFEKICKEEELYEVGKKIFAEHPGEQGYYNFTKYLWVEFPDDRPECRLDEIVPY